MVTRSYSNAYNLFYVISFAVFYIINISFNWILYHLFILISKSLYIYLINKQRHCNYGGCLIGQKTIGYEVKDLLLRGFDGIDQRLLLLFLHHTSRGND